ncbi:exosome complex exonuclease Rrp41 [Methanolobus halotolerans]|uniref:Exosome complex component Rrp41 n=1 Tax=Methanolobus halotolerans TaxID=2052935 RepID=A0A4E0PYD5_9EURY|nr:exosome complex exonuclease Rrp41 [Methanolobus halotolerans]TGC10539.1 exosome complex exonuclease Rrp41 [Methanolobus halotolerans]
MNDKPEKFIDENGLRLDGRQIDEIRPMTIKIGVLSRADGSCYMEWGNNKILVAVYGPRELHPRRLQKSDSALIRYRYNMAAFSVEDRIRPGPSRRSTEISKVSREAFEPVVMTNLYPSAVIDVFAEVLQADAGTRTAAINAASIALADAGIPMKSLVAACAVGKVDGKLVLDLNKPEDNYGQADLPIAMTQDGEITLLQMDGNLTQEEFKQALEMCKKGCLQILEMQKEALKGKFGEDAAIEVPEDIDEEIDIEVMVECDIGESEDEDLEEADVSGESGEDEDSEDTEAEEEDHEVIEEEFVDLVEEETADEEEITEGSEIREQ